MRKSQSEVLGTVVLTGILLLVVSITFLWGQPLIQKNIDKGQINTIMEKLNEINDAVISTASTGSNNIVELDLTTSAILLDELNNKIIMTTTSSVPVIASNTELPINYYELATTRENIAYNTTTLTTTDPGITGYNTQTHHANTTINTTIYNISVYQNTTSNNWELTCIWKNTLNNNNDCAKTGENILKENNAYELISILTGGDAAYFSGPIIENLGVLGSEPAGIISAESIRVGNKEDITFYITYRGMTAPTGEEHKILISCTSGCSASGTTKKLTTTRTNIIRESNITTTYINIGVE
ncbi:Uncharacterised protein [Candidatus Tiddalikarchaeum anstoanum]|nr:Uncharacterised protein [Candidatus Tiddalikarchaeum anstoanum]